MEIQNLIDFIIGLDLGSCIAFMVIYPIWPDFPNAEQRLKRRLRLTYRDSRDLDRAELTAKSEFTQSSVHGS